MWLDTGWKYIQGFHCLVVAIEVILHYFHGFQLLQTGLFGDFIFAFICIVFQMTDIGNVGASGDLVQLAHIALTLIGEGEVFYQGKKRDTASVLAENGLQPFKMHIREGLSVTNGTSVMTGIGIVNLIYARQLMHWAVGASVMMNEIAASYDDFMSEPLNEAKRHEGQQEIAIT
jgi:histidine ammonia-lyase